MTLRPRRARWRPRGGQGRDAAAHVVEHSGPGGAGPAEGGRSRRWRPRWWPDRWIVLIAVAVGYGPVVASSPGWVGADTKTYLYLDPGRLLARAPTLWDADRALGTVTHQNIGYLWPMGPFYWLAENLGLPDWLAQRLWLGTLLVLAGLGVAYLLRTLGWEGRGLLVAVLAYELSPYLLHYSARISIVLAPWAALGWLIGLTVRAARTGGWRYSALFALAAVTAGSVNATSLAMVGLAPALWLAHAAWVERSLSLRRAGAAAARIGALTAGVSLWWMAGLAVQGAYSLPVTRYTESYKAVADASTAPEILRGLGYWFFYGNDKLGAWIEPSVDYTQGLWLVFVGFGLVVGTLALAAALRWRHRGYFLLLLAVGALIGVGAHPWDGPSPAGALFKAFTRSDAGLALRSTPRAVPLVALAVAVLAGAGLNALHRRLPRFGAFVSVGVLAAVVLNNPAMWKVRMVEEHLRRPENLPEYWLEAAAAMDSAGPGRVWEVPGSDFASYRWGNTVDPITPGLIDRGYVARELVPFGSAQSAALLTAVDRRFQEQTLAPESLAPVARLMGASEIAHRADLTFERFRTPRPVETAALLERAPGLVEVAAHGAPVANEAGPEQTMIDEIRLARPADPAHPAPITRYSVADPRPLVGTRSAASAAVVVGDADGIVDSAAAGVVDFAGHGPVFFAADLVSDPELADLVLGAGTGQPAAIVVTDSNRRRAQRWGTLRENRGHTEMAGETPLAYDPTDNRLAVFDADPTDDTRTVSQQRGPVAARATAYGNPVTYTVDDRPALAVDGSAETAWVVGAFSDPRGEILRLELAEPGPVAAVRLLQPPGPANRRITEVEIRTDGRTTAAVKLDERSRTEPGQRVELGVEALVVELEITATDLDHLRTYPGIDPVGFAEVDLGLGPTTEVIRTPRALLDQLGPDLDRHDLAIVLTRERSDPREPVRADPEPHMVRAIPLPTEREATLQGTARLSAAAPSPVIDALLGLTPGSGQARVTATSSGRLAGDLPSRASAVLDGNPATAWTAAFGPQTGRWIEIALAAPTLDQTLNEETRPDAEVNPEVEVEVIEVDVVTDRLHSVPAAVKVLVDGASAGVFPTGLKANDASAAAPLDSTATVSLPVQASGRVFRLAVTEVSERLTRDWYSNTFQPLPVSIAEVRLSPDPVRLPPPTPVNTGCREDLVKVNGHPVPVRITGSATDAEARHPLDLEGCEPVTLTPDETLVVTTAGANTGIDIDQLVLTSPAPTPPPPASTGTGEGAPPAESASPGAEAALAGSASPTPSAPIGSPLSPSEVEVKRHRDTSFTATVPASTVGRWLVLAQSHNQGWQAVADGINLGQPVVIDGYANGWWLPPSDETVVQLRWTPQRLVDAALALSAIFALITIALAWKGRRYNPSNPANAGAAEFGPPLPKLAWPFSDPRHGPQESQASPRAVAAAAAATAATAALTLPQWPTWLPVALALGAIAAISLRWPRATALPLAAAATSLAAAAAWIMISQRRFRHPPDFGWPQRFEEVHILGITTILLALTAYICESAQKPRKRAPKT